MRRLSPDRLLQIGLGFRAAKTLLCAVELGVFTELGRGPRTAPQLRRALALDARATPDFLDALVAMGVLDREGDDAQAVYLNTREAGHFLDRRSPAYIGVVFENANARLYSLWGEFGRTLKGAPALSPDEPAAARSAGSATGSAFSTEWQALAEHFDFASQRTLIGVDTSGAPPFGVFALRHPQLDCKSADAFGPWPRADVIVVAGALREASLEGKLGLIRSAHTALPVGGLLIAIDPLIDDARRHGLHALLASLNARLETADAFRFSGADFDGWCRGAGFPRTEVIDLGASVSAAVAHR
ncbi:MAG: methyltransferase dimerization domain-containing protein [Burkholderiales bacterium]